MSFMKPFVLSALAAALAVPGSVAPAQIHVGINLGAAPVCPYGYFDYAPYNCAPYGYYGRTGSAATASSSAPAPWFHGPAGFHGHVDNRYDPHHGYHGPMPPRGAEPFNHFQGNEARDGHGHVGPAPHGPENEHALPGYHGGHR